MYSDFPECFSPLQAMESQNVSIVTEFQLLGFQNALEWWTLLFAIFLFIYFLTVTGDIVIIIVVSQDQRLHWPMYTFLKHFSFLEIWYTSTIVPLLPANLLSQGQAISFPDCIAQLYFFAFFGATKCFFWPWWPMAGIWPSVAHCTTLSWWVLRSAPSWWQSPGWQGSAQDSCPPWWFPS